MPGGQGMHGGSWPGSERGAGPLEQSLVKKGSLLDPSRPRPQATLAPGQELYRSTLCPSPPLCLPGPSQPRAPQVGSPSPPSACSLGSGPSTPRRPTASPPTPLRVATLLRPPRATPLSYRTPGPPTALPGGGCRSPSAIFSVRSRRGCSQFPLPVYPAPFPGSTKLPEEK